jgi:hypothetical protein
MEVNLEEEEFFIKTLQDLKVLLRDVTDYKESSQIKQKIHEFEKKYESFKQFNKSNL